MIVFNKRVMNLQKLLMIEKWKILLFSFTQTNKESLFLDINKV